MRGYALSPGSGGASPSGAGASLFRRHKVIHIPTSGGIMKRELKLKFRVLSMGERFIVS